MGPYCVWEMLSYALKGNWTKAFRRLRRKGVTAKLTDGALIHVQYPAQIRLYAASLHGFVCDRSRVSESRYLQVISSRGRNVILVRCSFLNELIRASIVGRECDCSVITF